VLAVGFAVWAKGAAQGGFLVREDEEMAADSRSNENC